MKFQLLTLFLVGLTSTIVNGRGFQLSNELINQLRIDSAPEVFLAKTISRHFISRLVREVRNINPDQDQDAKATLLPPLPDPVVVEPIEIPIDIRIPDPLIYIHGHVALTSPTDITGLSQLVDDFTLGVIIITGVVNVAYDLRLPAVALAGDYDMDLTLDLGSEHSILGNGALAASVDQVFLKLTAKAQARNIIGNLTLPEFAVDLGFNNLLLDGGEAHVDDTVIDWNSVACNIQTWFDTFWNEEVKGIINEMIRCSADHVINGCTIARLIDDAAACLKVELKPECFEMPILSKPRSVPTWTSACDGQETGEPVTSSDEPDTSSTDAPVTSSDEPDTSSTDAPVTSSDEPDTSSTDAPVTSSDEPDTSSTDAPVTSSDEPDTSSTDAPVTSSIAPGTSSDAPGSPSTGEEGSTPEVTTEKNSGSIAFASLPLAIPLLVVTNFL